MKSLVRLLPWPLPALAAWAAAWGLFIALRAAAWPLVACAAAAFALGMAAAAMVSTRWRQLFVVAGFPLSLAASGLGSAIPAWAWLAPLGLLLLLYPARTWGDAPLFPTPEGALDGLPAALPLPGEARVLDAGCGLGAGLLALRRAYPDARLTGLEWSWPLRIACAFRTRFATIRRADIWAADWSGYDLVYLFQRPDTLQRAVDKARREMRPGTWLASLEFEAAGTAANAQVTCPDGRPVWLYKIGKRKPASN